MASGWYVSKERGVLYVVWTHQYGSHMAAFHDARNRNSVLQSGPYATILDVYQSYDPTLVTQTRPHLTGGTGGTGGTA